MKIQKSVDERYFSPTPNYVEPNTLNRVFFLLNFPYKLCKINFINKFLIKKNVKIQLFFCKNRNTIE